MSEGGRWSPKRAASLAGYDPHVAYVAHIIGVVSIRSAASKKAEDLIDEHIAIGSDIEG